MRWSRSIIVTSQTEQNIHCVLSVAEHQSLSVEIYAGGSVCAQPRGISSESWLQSNQSTLLSQHVFLNITPCLHRSSCSAWSTWNWNNSVQHPSLSSPVTHLRTTHSSYLDSIVYESTHYKAPLHSGTFTRHPSSSKINDSWEICIPHRLSIRKTTDLWCSQKKHLAYYTPDVPAPSVCEYRRCT